MHFVFKLFFIHTSLYTTLEQWAIRQEWNFEICHDGTAWADQKQMSSQCKLNGARKKKCSRANSPGQNEVKWENTKTRKPVKLHTIFHLPVVQLRPRRVYSTCGTYLLAWHLIKPFVVAPVLSSLEAWLWINIDTIWVQFYTACSQWMKSEKNISANAHFRKAASTGKGMTGLACLHIDVSIFWSLW